jgi:membrane protease subunit HflK
MDQQFRDIRIPPEFQEILSKWKLILAILAVVILSFSSYFTVETEEVGVITRFGKYVRTVESGLKLKIPFIEKVFLVPVERQQKIEFGFTTVKADVRSEYNRGEEDLEVANMLTGDLNLADVEWVIQYRVEDPYNYLFRVRNPESTLQDISEATMRQIVGDRTVNEVITVGRTQIGVELKELLQNVCREYSLGIKIDQVVLQDVNPPGKVKEAFNAVNEAEQEKETLINQAESNRNKIIPKAKGQADETIQKAEGYAIARVNRANGEAARFNALYSEFIKAPEVTRQRIYLETMSDIVPKLGNKIITDQKGNNILPLLQMQLEKSQNEK